MSFGGPAGQIALMHRILVDEKKWVSEGRFLHALNYCMLLPGPEAQQLATYVGWLLHRTAGGLVAGLLFVLPGALVMWTLSVLYAGFNDLTVLQAVFFGIKAAVLAVVVEAVHRIGKRALKNGVMIGLAAVAFVAIFFLDIAFPVIVAAAALIGFVGGRIAPDSFVVIKGHGGKESGAVVDSAFRAGRLDHARPSTRRAVKVAAIWLTLWLGPLVFLAATLGLSHVFTQEGIFFSKMAVVTFGGAYAVLAYVAQQAVDTYGWLKPGEMLDGLGLAETTPGPLIMVLQFVGFLAAFRNPGTLDPMVAGTLGAIITTWMTVMFGRVDEVHAWGLKLQVPDIATIDLAVAALAAAAFVAMMRFKVNMLLVLAGRRGDILRPRLRRQPCHCAASASGEPFLAPPILYIIRLISE